MVGEGFVPITAQQAVLDTGSSVITATDVDALLINSVRSHALHRALLQLRIRSRGLSQSPEQALLQHT